MTWVYVLDVFFNVTASSAFVDILARLGFPFHCSVVSVTSRFVNAMVTAFVLIMLGLPSSLSFLLNVLAILDLLSAPCPQLGEAGGRSSRRKGSL